MRTFFQTLCLCLALAFAITAPTPEDGVTADAAPLDRCDGLEFDAITPDEKGNTFFFKGDQVWKGFRGDSQPSNESFKELDKHLHLGHVDAAFRMHNKDDPQDHDHIYLFLDDKVFSYYDQVLEEGYPKDIQQDFPGIPSHLDAAVECPAGECVTDSVLFFKGGQVYVHDIPTKVAKQREWSHLPNCTSAFRWLEHYYCFHGNQFTRFHPVTGDVTGDYPKDARAYFMSCPNFAHGGGHRSQTPKCSDISLDAITTDDTGRSYAFRGPFYVRLDSQRDGKHAFPITRSWKEVTTAVDAVFSNGDKMYMIVGEQVFIYKSAAHYTLIDGYPKGLKEELGVEGRVNAAFMCPDQNTLHLIQGQNLLSVDLSASPRVVRGSIPLPLSGISAAVCLPNGVRVFSGSVFYHYESVRIMAMGRIAPEPNKIGSTMFDCQED